MGRWMRVKVASWLARWWFERATREFAEMRPIRHDVGKAGVHERVGSLRLVKIGSFVTPHNTATQIMAALRASNTQCLDTMCVHRQALRWGCHPAEHAEEQTILAESTTPETCTGTRQLIGIASTVLLVSALPLAPRDITMEPITEAFLSVALCFSNGPRQSATLSFNDLFSQIHKRSVHA